MKEIVFIPYGLFAGNILCGDANHNGANELIFFKWTSVYPTRNFWTILEYRLVNRYELVFADTGPTYPYPPGIHTGNFQPEDIGDIDSDSLTDLLGPNKDKPNFDTTYYVATTQESPNYSTFPTSLTWWFRHSSNFIGEGGANYYFPPDLDNDGRKEILKGSSNPQYGLMIFENVANNINVLVFSDTSRDGYNHAFGDFDLDGHYEFVTATLGSRGIVYICENTGDNQYDLVRVDTVGIPNGHDVFSGDDVDGDGHPEFFIRFARVGWTFYLYMWEATGNNTYQRTLVDQVSRPRFDPGDMKSLCGDVDGDSIDEIVWSIASDVFVYKATGNNQFQVVWHWVYPGPNDFYQAIVNIYDMNKNGYNEIVISGNDTTRIFEVEAVRLLRPNGGENFHADSNELIQWQKFYPPRCDSLSLFYSIDNGSNYTMITHGISGNDTSYLWTVPNTNSDSCKVKIIAYGPGWQYDESDGTFSITSTGIKEIATLPLAMTLGVKVYPNPTKSLSVIRYSLPVEGQVSLKLYNISGRLVKTLVNEHKQPGNYSINLNSKTLSAGVYFITLQTQEKRIIERVIIIK